MTFGEKPISALIISKLCSTFELTWEWQKGFISKNKATQFMPFDTQHGANTLATSLVWTVTCIWSGQAILVWAS